MPKYHYSASQIATFRDCRRKWAFKTIDKIDGAPNAYAELGTLIHHYLEQYLQDGSLPGGQEVLLTVEKRGKGIPYTGDDILAIMLPGLKHLPKPGIAIPEEGFEIDLGELGTLVGYIDAQFVDCGVPVTVDHKTTSGLQWALTGEELREDPQGVIYSVYAMEKSGLDTVKCRWIYYLTDPKKARSKKTEVEIRLTDLAKSWQNIIVDVQEMKRLRDSGVKAAGVPYDARACDKYGGCPYRTICGLTPMDRMRSLNAMLSLKERMKARQTSTPTTTETPAPTQAATLPATIATPAPTVTNAINPPEGMSALARLKAKQQAATPAAPTPAVQVEPAPAAPVAQAVKPEEQVIAKVAPAKKAKAAPTPSKTGFVLYIDCAPNKECIQFAEIASVVSETIKIEKGAHYRLIEGLYGGNAALFSEAVGTYLDLTPPAGDIVMASTSQEARDAMETVIKRAALVVRGF